MSNVLSGLTDEQIKSSYTLSTINKMEDNMNDTTDNLQTQINEQYIEVDEDFDNIYFGPNIVHAPGSATTDANICIGFNASTAIGIQNVVINSQIAGAIDGVYIAGEDIKNCNRNILIGPTSVNPPTHFPTGTNDVIIIGAEGPTNLNNNIPSGSIMIGTSMEQSTQPKFQIGGDNLINALAGGVLPGNPDAYIRIRYKNANYKIPVFTDNDNPNP